MKAVSIKNISKSYGAINALKNISFEVEKGELFGIIGPDGAGKTTLFRLLTTLLLANEGDISVMNFDVKNDFKEIRKIVGYMPGKFSLYQDLSIEENLNFFATVFNTTVTENLHLIKEIYDQIEPFKKRLAGKLSGGMKQKLALCCALIHEPAILFLDEPTTGVDPVSRKEFWDMLDRLKQKGITILVSTPYMDEASRCDRIALIHEGTILDVDTLDNIIAKNTDNLFAISGPNRHNLISDIRSYKNTISCFAFGEVNHVSIANENMEELNDYLQQKGHLDLKINKIKPDIEDTFIKLINA